MTQPSDQNEMHVIDPDFEVPAFEQVYEEHFDFVWRSTRRLGVDTAAIDDVVQDIFLVVYRRLDTFEGRSSLKTWLFGIARRVVSDHRRSLARRKPHQQIPEGLASTTEGPDEEADRAQAAEVLRAFLEGLNDDQRSVFMLAELEGMTAPEIAEATDTKLNTVYSRLRLARESFNRAVRRFRARVEGGIAA